MSPSVPAVPRISVVTPTLRRPEEVAQLWANLAGQRLQPSEFILVDGAPAGENETQRVAEQEFGKAPFACRYIRHGGGTAVQRNVGIEAVQGEFVAFIDDDIRLEPDFFAAILAAYQQDAAGRVGGIVGYRTNEFFTPAEAARWRWYRRLRLLTTFEPGRYDFATGYPINANLQPPFSGVRPVDFMTTSCAVWRREALASGLRFHPFFRDYGVLEDAHFSLRAGKTWQLWQCGDAQCTHHPSRHGRANRHRIGYKCVVNYYYVFRDVAGPLSTGQQFRFWRYQLFELMRVGTSALRRLRVADAQELAGRLQGFLAVLTGSAWRQVADAPTARGPSPQVEASGFIRSL